jgi:hypothetical protein
MAESSFGEKIMAETISTRVTRLEKAMIKLANAQAHLAEVQAQDQTEARERERRIDERIEKLVIAIGEFIRRQNGKEGRGG